jgi:predicted MFS family arabinose efflux permease
MTLAFTLVRRFQHGRVTARPAEPTAVPASGSPGLPLWGLLALATAAFTDVVTDLLPSGLLPQMSRALHVPEARVGLLVSAFAVTSAVAAIPVTAALRGLPRRPVLALLATAMVALGWAAPIRAVLLLALAVWGAAFGGAPTLLQTALIDASGPASADVATSMQTTIYNIGIAAGSLAGGLTLAAAGAGALPWFTSSLAATALAAVAVARSHAFPARRPTARNRRNSGSYPAVRRGAAACASPGQPWREPES